MRRDLRAIVCDGAAFSVMVGIGETYLPAFALAAGMGSVLAGLVASLPMLGGAILQLMAPAGVRMLGSHRRWVVACAACQALCFAPLVTAAYLHRIPTWLVYGVATIYWATGLATGPAWNTWVGRIIPARLRAPFFARRTRFSQAGVLVGFLAGGLLLQAGTAQGDPLTAFAILFGVALLSRSISSYCLASQSEPKSSIAAERYVGPLELLGRIRRGGDGALLLYLLSVQVAVQISGPFFTPFMIRELKMSYAAYVALLGLAYLAKIVALPTLGRLARNAGTWRVLWLGGIGIIPVSAMWLVSDSFYFLAFVQVFGGFAWAAYELAMMLLFFETIHERERTSVLTLFNVGNALAMVVGSLAGGALLHLMGESRWAFYMVFAASGLARVVALGVLAFAREIKLEFVPLLTRTIAVRPAAGTIERPILTSSAVKESGEIIVAGSVPQPANDAHEWQEPAPMRRAA
ncbi:MAG: MFS transporter [Pirellulales bacterium]|nr:MFS transporter [Pirellulales bacterium]